jgi:hypothetical protein
MCDEEQRHNYNHDEVGGTQLARLQPDMVSIAGDTTSLYRELMERNIELVISRMIGRLADGLAAEFCCTIPSRC